MVVVRDPRALDSARTALERELDLVDRACSRFRADSELTRVNESAGAPVRVTPYLLDALERAIDAAAETAGVVDPTVGRALRLNGYDQTFARVRLRDGSVFAPQASRARRWRRLEIDRERQTVTVPADVELDLGATAKAFAADRAARAAADETSCGVLVSLGGDIAVSGDPPLGGWSVGLADDHAAEPHESMPRVAIGAGGIATSSTTVRCWRTTDGERHHIVDPRTGTSAETPWRTVTVAAASCLDANTASTAALVLGKQAVSWLEARRLPSRLVGVDGAVTVVGGWPAEAA